MGRIWRHGRAQWITSEAGVRLKENYFCLPPLGGLAAEKVSKKKRPASSNAIVVENEFSDDLPILMGQCHYGLHEAMCRYPALVARGEY